MHSSLALLACTAALLLPQSRVHAEPSVPKLPSNQDGWYAPVAGGSSRIEIIASVIPAKAGMQCSGSTDTYRSMDSGLRGIPSDLTACGLSRIASSSINSGVTLNDTDQDRRLAAGGIHSQGEYHDSNTSAQTYASSSRTSYESIFQQAQSDLSTATRKAATSAFWSGALKIGAVTLISAIADKPMDRYATNHGSSQILRDIKNVGNALPLAAIGFSSAMLLTSDEDTLISRTSYDALAAGGLGFASALSLKYAVGRARPSAEQGSSSFTPLDAGNGNTSWPSIHTTVMWAMVTPYAKTYDAPWLYGVAAVTNAARIAGRDHWFSDTVAGALIGYAIGDFVWSSHQTSDHQADWVISPNRVAFNWRFD